MKNLCLPIVVVIFSFSLQAQKNSKKWDVANPTGWSFKEITLSTDEGTWMNLDVSPEGNQVVFDMLGDIYIIPMSGGDAKVLRSGLAFEVQDIR